MPDLKVSVPILVLVLPISIVAVPHATSITVNLPFIQKTHFCSCAAKIYE